MKDYSKKIMLLLALMMSVSYASAKKQEPISIIQGDPFIIQQENKTAIYEIDYSKLIVEYGRKNDQEASFRDWMIMQNEDTEEWIKDWEEKDSAEVDKTFRECFSDNIRKAMKLTKTGKDYKVILRLNRINFGKESSFGKVMLFGSGAADCAIVSGEIEILDLKTGESKLILAFDKVAGDGQYTQMKRFRNVIDNLCNRVDEFLKSYRKQLEKEQKKK